MAVGAAYHEAMNVTPPADRAQSWPGYPLRAALAANAAFSGLSGAVLALGSAHLDAFLGLDRVVLVASGLALLGFAAPLLAGAARRQLTPVVGWMAVSADVAWIVGAIVVIGLGHVLTAEGNQGLALVTAVVAALAGVQWLGLRRLRTEIVKVAR